MRLGKTLKRLFKNVLNLTPFPVWYASDLNLSSLKRKINFYLFFSPSQRNTFSREKSFLDSYARLSDHFSFLFPYPFVFDYSGNHPEVHMDGTNGLLYVIHNGKRLYYSRKYRTETEVRDAYNGIALEQDKRSPHCYTDDIFKVKENDVVVDIGAAEGNFSLDVIDRAGKVYIVEPDNDWIEALNATFMPFKDKVHIINKYASDIDSGDFISLSGMLGADRVHFIKMDVGGAESRIIRSSAKLFEENPTVRLAACTYHRKKDAVETEKILSDLGFKYSYTDGYMLYIFNNLTPPYFRKTLIRAQKGI
jgi:precorrin-6B methylase 2